ncbi:hypothetical protein B9Z19DRAFT_1111748 [Tuber borchii]|uniref:Uncharacterized protein n=1 Tax=Tuber borchii TaxID=42251 RepID=A0A2T6ZAD3_TUBBO|nr:hypothetical protein B9Z19DRAFT_1111748 [Tuber borchii]
MAPIPFVHRDAKAVLSTLLSTKSSATSPEGIDIAGLNGHVTPSLLPSPPPIAPLELPVPAGFELGPLEPEKEPLSETARLQSPDVYEGMVSNRWNSNHKRSSMILVSFIDRDAYTANP